MASTGSRFSLSTVEAQDPRSSKHLLPICPTILTMLALRSHCKPVSFGCHLKSESTSTSKPSSFRSLSCSRNALRTDLDGPNTILRTRNQAHCLSTSSGPTRRFTTKLPLSFTDATDSLSEASNHISGMENTCVSAPNFCSTSRARTPDTSVTSKSHSRGSLSMERRIDS